MHVCLLEPILAIRLIDLGMGTLSIGVMFCILPFGYAITVVSSQFLPDWIEKRVRMIISVVMNFVACLCIGPSLLLYFPESVTIMCIGHALCGTFGS